MNTDDLLTTFRSELPLPDEATSRRLYSSVMGGRSRLPRLRLVAVLGLTAATAAVGVIAATWSRSADALPAPFQPAQAMLSDQFDIQVSPLPVPAEVAVSERRAEEIALGHPRSSPAGVTATLVSATDGQYANVAPGGTRTLVISDRTAWLVLVPGRQVPIIYPYGKSGPLSYPATSAVLIDANTGAFLIEAELSG